MRLSLRSTGCPGPKRKNFLPLSIVYFTSKGGLASVGRSMELAEHQSLVKYTMLKGYTSVRLLLGSTQLVDGMNARATGLTNSRLGWSFEEEAQYRILINAILFM